MQTETQASPKELAQAKLKAAEINMNAARERLAEFQRDNFATVDGVLVLKTGSVDEKEIAAIHAEQMRLMREYEAKGAIFQDALRDWAHAQ